MARVLEFCESLSVTEILLKKSIEDARAKKAKAQAADPFAATAARLGITVAALMSMTLAEVQERLRK